MNRSCYSEDMEDTWSFIRWRGAVTSAIKGKRGQEFLKEMLETLDSMPEKKLVKGALMTETGEVCAIGSVMAKRGIDPQSIDIYDSKAIANQVGISDALVREIEFINDDAWDWNKGITDEVRWEIVRGWVANQIKND